MYSDKEKERAFLALLDCYAPIVAKVCYFYSTDVDDFNDLRQEVLINLWQGFERFRGEADISTWIYRVSLNSCVSYFRRHKKNYVTQPIDFVPDIMADDIDRRRLIADMYSLINCLDKEEKALILLWLDGYAYEAIADVVGIPRNTVASRLHRIKEKIVKISNL